MLLFLRYRKVMKRILGVSILLLSISLILFSCKKNKGPAFAPSVDPKSITDSLKFLSASVNNSGWTTQSLYGYRVKSTADTNKWNLLMIATAGKGDTSSTISFTITDFKGNKNYTINPPFVSAYFKKYDVVHNAASGFINITESSDTAIRGDLYFVADTFTINNGTYLFPMP